MARKLSLDEIAIRRQVILERVKSSLVNEAQAILAAIGPDSISILSTLGVERINELNRDELQAVISSLREKHLETMGAAVEGLTASLEELAATESEFELNTLRKTAPSMRFRGLLQRRAFDYARDKPVAATGQLLDDFLKEWTEKQVAQISNTIGKGYTNGATTDQIIRTIRGTKKQNYTDGIVAISRRNCASIVRTAVQHVASEARFCTWEANSDIIKFFQVIATLDENTTQKCRSLDKQKFPINEGPRPPYHIGCRTTTSAVIEGLDFLDEGATRSAANGPVDANQSYYEWLKTQDADFQKEALGATRAKLFASGELSAKEFAALNLGSNFEPLTLKQMKALNPAIFEKIGIE